MSTTFGILKEGISVKSDSCVVDDMCIKIAHRRGVRDGVEIKWLSDLAVTLPNETRVYPLNNSRQGVETIGDLRELGIERYLKGSIMEYPAGVGTKDDREAKRIACIAESMNIIRTLNSHKETFAVRYFDDQIEITIDEPTNICSGCLALSETIFSHFKNEPHQAHSHFLIADW